MRARGALGNAQELRNLRCSRRWQAGEREVTVETVGCEELLEEGCEQAHVELVVHTTSIDSLAKEGAQRNPWDLFGRDVATSACVKVEPVVNTVKRTTLVLNDYN